MNAIRWLRVTAGTLLLLAVAGCTSIDSRIKKNQTYFDSLSAEQRQNLRNGIVKLGYTMKMSLIAYGAPDTAKRTESADGQTISWIYSYDRPIRGSRFGHHAFDHMPLDRGGRYHDGLDRLPFDRLYYERVDALRLDFKDSKIVRIEHLL